jgi:hypothetical protein
MDTVQLTSNLPQQALKVGTAIMSKVRVNRVLFRSGRVLRETHVLNGLLHGVSRTWHRNGQLALLECYRSGKLHGVCGAWTEKGSLLGKFEMLFGTGTQRHWHSNGQLRLEIPSIDGRFHGRVRQWLRDGTLGGEDFYIEGNQVSRAAYLKAARSNLHWPQYEAETAGKSVRRTRNVEMKDHELFINSVLTETLVVEARQWLREKPKRTEARKLGKFRSAKSASGFVDSLYSAGATEVKIAGIHQGPKPGVFADWILVGLPKSKVLRKGVRSVCRELSLRTGVGFEPEKDIGESHLFGLLA